MKIECLTNLRRSNFYFQDRSNKEQSDFQTYSTSNLDDCIVLPMEERDRILKITIDTAQALLNNQNLEQAMPLCDCVASPKDSGASFRMANSAIAKALQIIGEGIDTDRVAVMKHHNDPLGASSGYLKMLYEWHSPHAVSHLHHPDFQQVSYEGIENWYEQLSQGKTIGGVIEELPEVIHREQAAIGVKSTYAIPIVINERYWGIVAFDDCREAKQRSETEISILKTAAVCVGSAIEKNRVCLQQQEAERNILLERQRVTQLARHNKVLQQRDREIQQSYRLLEITASVANIISTEGDFDTAIAKALQIIGKGIETDRILVAEYFENPADSLYLYWKIIYEWDSADTVSQMNHLEAAQGSYEGIEEWYEIFSNGQSISYRLEQMPEPFRSLQAKVGVKMLHAVPIIVEEKQWGVLVIDDCTEEKHRSEAELNILKTAAACIGGAIEKERIRCAQEQAEKAILLEREKTAIAKAAQLEESNQTLSLRDKWLEATANAANKLLKINDLDQGINAALKVLGESLNCDRVNIMKHFNNGANKSHEFVRMIYEWYSPHAVSQMSHPELHEVSVEGIEDWFVKLKAGDWIGGTIDELREPFRNGQIKLGVKATYSVPIFVDRIYWGAICIDFCREPRRLTKPEIAVFKTAASCIGSAIYRQQIQQDKEQAEVAILNERNRMAREIHDTLAQAFTGISLQLEAARNILATQPNLAQERLLQAKKLAKEGIAEARRSVRALRPEALESKNLAIALHQLVDNMTSGTDTKAQLIIEGETQLASDLEADLFRLAQEAVTNTLRHAQATELIIRLVRHNDLVELQIKDNGIGFEPQQLLDSSFGLMGMQERCDRHNGHLVINSSRDLGTEIIVIITIN